MEFAGRYGFQHLPLEKFPCWENKEIKEKLTKWSMLDGIRLKAYSFTRPFKDYLHEEFIKKFFACPVVTSTFETANNFKFAPIGTPAELVKFSKVSCTHTTMELFDKLTQNEAIVRQCGGIVQCAPEYVRLLDFTEGGGDQHSDHLELEVNDNLRKTILTTLIPPLARSSELEIEPDLENVFSSEDTKEFLFQLFAHLVLGGSLCQYEDYITQYLEVTKVLYKNLVSVMLTPEEEGLSVVSSIFKIHSISNPAFSRGKNLLFGRQHINNFCYLIVNPYKQICFTFYHNV
ncbi:cilia- and flagella-associated protein 300-like [Folsomia candida]|uniref:cilia- and flagella-associated protein 300-like n=1 Tax=Folsomia candida TaxID=158441 RepID=UPI001604D4DD|nr:cilia- and flagella-associated protein 300-like [Folsomia candida]